MIEQSNEPVFDLKCSEENCDQMFNRFVDLHNHLFYHHKTVKLECPICKKHFPTQKLLRLHEKSHGAYECDMCKQRFNLKAYLKLHLKTHEEQREMFECSLCGKTFKQKSSMQVHIKSKHENLKYKCLLCTRELSTRQKLQQHMEKRHKQIEDLQLVLDDVQDDYSNDRVSLQSDNSGGDTLNESLPLATAGKQLKHQDSQLNAEDLELLFNAFN